VEIGDKIQAALEDLAPELRDRYLGYFLRRNPRQSGGWIISNLRGHVLPSLPKDAPIVDVCCGVGFWLAYIGDMGYRNLIGTDYDASKGLIAKGLWDKVGIPAEFRQGSKLDPLDGMAPASLGLISCMDSWYDLEQGPDEFLSRSSELLRPGGYVALDWYQDERNRKQIRSYLTTSEVRKATPPSLYPFLTMTRDFNNRVITLYVWRKR